MLILLSKTPLLTRNLTSLVSLSSDGNFLSRRGNVLKIIFCGNNISRMGTLGYFNLVSRAKDLLGTELRIFCITRIRGKIAKSRNFPLAKSYCFKLIAKVCLEIPLWYTRWLYILWKRKCSIFSK